MAVQGALWLAKRLSLNLNFSFLNQTSWMAVRRAKHYTKQAVASPTIVLPAKEDLWQSLSYIASWNGGPRSLDSYGWLQGERRACRHKVITHQAGLKVLVWQLWVGSIATDCKQWPWLGFCQNRTSLVALWLDTFVLYLTSSIFRSSLAHLFRDHLSVELL